MQISTLGVQLTNEPNAPVYTWQQTWRFFFIGTLYAVGFAVLPVLWQVGHDYVKHDGHVDMPLLWGTILATTGPALYSYWREHKALLKIPPFLDIPPEFLPSGKKLVLDQTRRTSLAPGPPASKTEQLHTEISMEDKDKDVSEEPR